MEGNLNGQAASNARTTEILEAIMSYARLDFTNKLEITGKDETLDAIAAGVNMLGEELVCSTFSLQEKEILLKELHHRVKNNLQIINSLINLQEGMIRDPEQRIIMHKTNQRIKSMALVHEMLHSSNDLVNINVAGYTKNLIKHLSYTYIGDRSKFDFNVNLDNHMHFEMDTMIPLGLILNEVISNSMQHAFGNEKGWISIVSHNDNGKSSIMISDNGKGLRSDFELEKHAQFGLQLISILCDQIDAELKIDGKQGVRVEMIFNK